MTEEIYYGLGALTESLCCWFQKNKRSMPWREDASPYHVWLSEIMLQQTRVEAVKSYYKRFTERLPDVQHLAQVSEDELMKLWEGLGYYNRARNLQRTARILVERYQGKLPADYDLLLELPGIGSYTAGAIASIAFGLPAPAVDGNVLRVCMRYLDCEDDISKAAVKRKLERSIRAVIPKNRPGEFNQALMELGEVCCIPNGMPLCHACPIASICQGNKKGRQQSLPVKPAKKERRQERRTVLFFVCGDRVGIRRRPDTGLLAGLWEFPSLDGYRTRKQMEDWIAERGISLLKLESMGSEKHIFSHVVWHMRGYRIVVRDMLSQDIMEGMRFVEPEELREIYSIPTAFQGFLGRQKRSDRF